MRIFFITTRRIWVIAVGARQEKVTGGRADFRHICVGGARPAFQVQCLWPTQGCTPPRHTIQTRLFSVRSLGLPS